MDSFRNKLCEWIKSDSTTDFEYTYDGKFNSYGGKARNSNDYIIYKQPTKIFEGVDIPNEVICTTNAKLTCGYDEKGHSTDWFRVLINCSKKK